MACTQLIDLSACANYTWCVMEILLQCVVVLSLLMLPRPVLCDPPEPPKMPASFLAHGEVEHHLPEETRFGKCEFL